jgi:hypothetical protein
MCEKNSSRQASVRERYFHLGARDHDVVTVTFSLGLLRSMASPTSTNSLSVRQSLDWPLWSGHFPASSV